jgi:hypothetical protein
LFVQVVPLSVQMVVDGQRPHPEPSAAQVDCPAAFVVRPFMLAMYTHVDPTTAHDAPGHTVEPQGGPDTQAPAEQLCPWLHVVPPATQPDPLALHVRTVLPSHPSWFGVQIWATHVPAVGLQYWEAVHVASTGCERPFAAQRTGLPPTHEIAFGVQSSGWHTPVTHTCEPQSFPPAT